MYDEYRIPLFENAEKRTIEEVGKLIGRIKQRIETQQTNAAHWDGIVYELEQYAPKKSVSLEYARLMRDTCNAVAMANRDALDGHTQALRQLGFNV